MLPVLSSLVVGSESRNRGQAFLLSVAYVVPMALTYAVMGVLAALAGANLQAVLQQPVVILVFAGVFVLLAAAMFGLYELQLPAWLRDRLHTVSEKQRGGTLVGAALMGILSAVLVGPCMTAPLAGALQGPTGTADKMPINAAPTKVPPRSLDGHLICGASGPLHDSPFSRCAALYCRKWQPMVWRLDPVCPRFRYGRALSACHDSGSWLFAQARRMDERRQSGIWFYVARPRHLVCATYSAGRCGIGA